MPKRAAIYCRISSDPGQTALGIERQLKDCRAYAADRGWTIVAEYADNDLSADANSTRRPAYEQLQNAMRDGTF